MAKCKRNKSAKRTRQTVVSADERLPLTCGRSGACCHGKEIWINPWELAMLATGCGISPRDFRSRHTVDGGVRLAMDGAAGWQGLSQCCMYDPASGCRVHSFRPLACRLFPLGRKLQSGKSEYIWQGERFPCLESCPEVSDLPQLTLDDYLAGQEASNALAAQDAYLETVQDLAEGALVLLIDTGLARSGDRRTLPRWRELGKMSSADRAVAIPADWFDMLTVPQLSASVDNHSAFVREHHDALQARAQFSFGALSTADEMHDASCLMMAMCLQLGRSLGIDSASLAERWIKVAKENGA